MAQLVAVKWDREQEIVWPTARDKVKGAKFTTEKFVAAVLDEVKARHKIDPRRVYTLSWSSGGPAAYAVALSVPAVKGSFVAMSVYRPDRLPPLKAAKGHAFFLYHSPEDRVCPAWMARRAQRELTANGARVTLLTYPGGHGWFGDWRVDVRSGIRWLDRPEKKD
jgi:predicted esterase